jgi:hypothetical protein
VARLAADAKRPTALVIDEFQKVIQLGGQGAEAQMRAAVQRNTDIGFIFAGSKTTLLNDMTLNPARPFYRMGIRHFLSPLPRVLTAAVKESGTALASQAVTERYGVSASTMSKALKFLENREVLRREELRNSMRWRLEDPFFAAWLDR